MVRPNTPASPTCQRPRCRAKTWAKGTASGMRCYKHTVEMFAHSRVPTSFDRRTYICTRNRMRLDDMVTNFLALKSHWQDCPPECNVNTCPHLEGIPRVPRQEEPTLPTGFDPDCKDCMERFGSPSSRPHNIKEIIHHEDGRHTLVAEDGMGPGRMGRLEYDQQQVVKLWAGVLRCGLREEARVPLAILLPQMAEEGCVFREDVDLMETLNRWDSRLLTNDSVLNLGELRLWFED